jgi:hypothetical protein
MVKRKAHKADYSPPLPHIYSWHSVLIKHKYFFTFVCSVSQLILFSFYRHPTNMKWWVLALKHLIL